MPKISRRKEGTKLGAEINETDQKTIEEINKTEEK